MNIDSGIKSSAKPSIDGIKYQYYWIIKLCYSLGKGETIYIENDGDISKDGGNATQAEIKHHEKGSLTLNSIDLWKTIYNWTPHNNFDHTKYKYLCLITTQKLDDNLENWDNLSVEEKYKLLESCSSGNEDINRYKKDILSTNNTDNIKDILEKVRFYASSDKLKELRNSIAIEHLTGIPIDNQEYYFEALLGFVFNDCRNWEINKNDFTEKCIDLTRQYAKQDKYNVPKATPAKSVEALDKEREANPPYLQKIYEIEYDAVAYEAMANFLGYCNALKEELDGHATFKEDIEQEKLTITTTIKTEHRKRCRNLTDDKNTIRESQNFYDDTKKETFNLSTYDEAKKQQGTTVANVYKNGMVQDVMNSEETLKWKLELEQKI